MTSQKAHVIVIACFLAFAAYCVGCVLSLDIGSASAQGPGEQGVYFKAGRGFGHAGEYASIDLSMLNSQPVNAFSMNVYHSGGALTVIGAGPSEYLASLNGGLGPDYYESRLWNPTNSPNHGLAVLCILDMTATQNTIPATPVYQPMVKAEYNIASTAIPGQNTAVIRFTELLIGYTQVYNEATINGGMPVTPTLLHGSIAVVIDFVRGDANLDGLCTLSDGVALLSHLFSGTSIFCKDAADANDDTQLNIADVMLILGYSLTGSLPPEAPFPGCDYDRTADSLGCMLSNCP